VSRQIVSRQIVLALPRAHRRFRRRAPMIEGGETPPNGRGLEKRTRGMLGLRIIGEGMGRGNGESITTNVMTSRHTNVTETNQRPAIVVYWKCACTHMRRSANTCK